MKINIISKNDSKGGAAIAALRLHKSFENYKKELKISSRMKVAFKFTNASNVEEDLSSFSKKKIILNNKIERVFQKLQISKNSNCHSLAFMPTNLHNEINKSNFDIVNLHWIQGGMISIEQIAKIKKPIIWTLHDTWAFCGAEHYPNSLEDTRYIEGYKKNNMHKFDRGLDLDRWCWQRKLKNWINPIQIVCPSNWLADIARKSFLMRNWPISVIPNPLDLNIFKPIEKEFARRNFNLPISNHLILFGSISGTRDKRKGWELIKIAFEKLRQTNQNIELVLLGPYDPKIENILKIPIHFVGTLLSEKLLAVLYSAVDVVVIPSLMENLPQIGTESQSCGTPVVAFDCSGLSDVVIHKETGYLAKPYDAMELAEGVDWILKNKDRYQKISLLSRTKAKFKWDRQLLAGMYVKLFQDVILRAKS